MYPSLSRSLSLRRLGAQRVITKSLAASSSALIARHITTNTRDTVDYTAFKLPRLEVEHAPWPVTASSGSLGSTAAPNLSYPEELTGPDALYSEHPPVVSLKLLLAGSSRGANSKVRVRTFTHRPSPDEQRPCPSLDGLLYQGPDQTTVAFGSEALGCGMYTASIDYSNSALRAVGCFAIETVVGMHDDGVAFPSGFSLDKVCLETRHTEGDSRPHSRERWEKIRRGMIQGLKDKERVKDTKLLNTELDAGPMRNLRLHRGRIFSTNTYDFRLGEDNESFKCREEDRRGILANRSPEVILGYGPGIQSDLWALGCTLFEIRTGHKLFSPHSEPWWSDSETPKYHFDGWTPQDSKLNISWDITPGITRSIREALLDRGNMAVGSNTTASEIDAFADLLGKLLRYRPEDRIPAREALEHEWVQLQDAYCELEEGALAADAESVANTSVVLHEAQNTKMTSCGAKAPPVMSACNHSKRAPEFRNNQHRHMSSGCSKRWIISTRGTALQQRVAAKTSKRIGDAAFGSTTKKQPSTIDASTPDISLESLDPSPVSAPDPLPIFETVPPTLHDHNGSPSDQTFDSEDQSIRFDLTSKDSDLCWNGCECCYPNTLHWSPPYEHWDLDSGSYQLLRYDSKVDLERLEDYRPGGHHPVHLGDLLHCGRYRVLHKISSGNDGRANSWIVRDLQSDDPLYVAVEIHMSEDSIHELSEGCEHTTFDVQHVRLHSNSFRTQGPNGSHLCKVYPVLWPWTAICEVQWAKRELSTRSPSYENQIRRGVSYRAVKALASLHGVGISHGAFRPDQLMFPLDNSLDGLSEEELLPLLNKPERIALTTLSGARPNLPSVPKYVVLPIPIDRTDTCFNMPGALLKLPRQAERNNLSLSLAYWSPERTLHETDHPSIADDLWALGCALVELRAGITMFDPNWTFGGWSTDDHFKTLVHMLGWSPKHPGWEVGPKHIENIREEVNSRGLMETRDGQYHARNTTSEELDAFVDILSKLWDIRPDRRTSAKQALDHEWFQMRDWYSEAEEKIQPRSRWINEQDTRIWTR